MMDKTKSQKDLIFAEECVSKVDADYPDKDNKTRKIYGGLCHNFPVMVMTCGLCQAVAFSLSKAVNGKDRGKAHALLLAHVAGLIDKPDAKPEQLIELIQEADTMTYLLYTRRVLSAWVYFKRFAVSILKVDAGQDNDKGGVE